MKKILTGIAASALLMLLASCGTTSNAAKTEETAKAVLSESNTEIAANKMYLRDWTARSMGGAARPAWLQALFLGDDNQYKTQFNVSDDAIIKTNYITAADVRGAQMRADMQFARQIAKDLQQSIFNSSAQQSRAGKIDEPTKDAIMEVTQAQSSVELSGLEKRTEFYHIEDEQDALTGKITRKCVLYQVYVIPQTTWARITATYLKKILGDMPEELSLDEEAVMNMVNTAIADNHHPVVMNQKQKEQELEYSAAMAQAQVNLEPEKQKAAAQQELVKIVQDGKTDRTKIAADAKTKQVQSLADAQTMAVLSGNPAVASAATVTPADANSIEAQQIAYDILFGN